MLQRRVPLIANGVNGEIGAHVRRMENKAEAVRSKLNPNLEVEVAVMQIDTRPENVKWIVNGNLGAIGPDVLSMGINLKAV